MTKAVDVRIVRHVKIRGNANPCDPEQEMYFERRMDKKADYELRGRGAIYYLWKKQNGRCPVCQQRID